MSYSELDKIFAQMEEQNLKKRREKEQKAQELAKKAAEEALVKSLEPFNTITIMGEENRFAIKSLKEGWKFKSEITIPGCVKFIDSSAFALAKNNLKTVIIEEGVEDIGANAFEGCRDLENVNFPSTLKRIQSRAFSECKMLNINMIKLSTDIPGLEIADNAFEETPTLTALENILREFDIEVGVLKEYKGKGGNVAIPDGVVSIENGAFDNCSSLLSVTIPSSVIKIGDKAFTNCKGLKQITLPENLSDLGAAVFYGCDNLTEIHISEENPSYKAIDGNLYSKDEKTLLCYAAGKTTASLKVSKTVVTIANSAFSGCAYIEKVLLLDGIENIEDSAFGGCKKLKNISLPKTVKNVGKSTFKGCSLLSITVEYKKQAEKWGKDWSCGCNVIYHDVEEAKRKAAEEAKRKAAEEAKRKAEEERIRKEIAANFEIENGVLKKYKGKGGKVVIPESVTDIGEKVFYNCSSLTSITIPDSVKSIGNYAFEGCSSITSIIIPDSVTGIGEWAFFRCSSLASITIPDSVKSIGADAFYGCSSLTSITVDENNEYYKSIDSNLYSKDGTTLIQYATGKSDSEFTIPNSVTSIDWSAFRDCYNLASIIIDKSNVYYKSIDGNLYSKDGTTLIRYAIGKSNYEFTIPNGVKNIDEWAFEGCSSLASITIPDSVTSIDSYAFFRCSSLVSITIPDSVTSIGWSAFRNCSSLTSVTIPDGVTSISWAAFWGCSSLTSITIPDSVTSIGGSAFRNCSSLTSVTIGNSVTSIGRYAFYNCSSLTSITIPDSVTSIGESAFFNCSKLTITVPSRKATENWGKDWNDKCKVIYHDEEEAKRKAEEEAKKAEIARKAEEAKRKAAEEAMRKAEEEAKRKAAEETKRKAAEEAKRKAEESRKAEIAANFEIENGVLKKYKGKGGKVVIPESVTDIGEKVFYNCSSLTSITIPDSVKSIGNYAFEGCSSITSITIPDSVTRIGNYAFAHCSSLTSVTIGNGVTSIGEEAFWYCSSLTSITIPDSVTSIGYWAFHGCSSLTSITVDENNEYYKSIDGNLYAKDGKTLIQYAIGKTDSEFTIPDSVTSIDSYAFDGCSSLTSVIFGENIQLTTLGYSAFYSCSSLTSITIPDGVTSIGGYAFYGCSSLTSVTIPDSVTSIGGYAFYGCSSLTSVTIPDSVTSIGSYAFYNCSSLVSVTIGNGVTSIDASAFSGCPIQTATIPTIAIPYIINSDLTTVVLTGGSSIESRAFRNCSSLTSITIPDSVISIGEGALDNCPNLKDICFKGTKKDWRALHFHIENSSVKIHCSDGDVKKFLFF